MVFPVRSPRGSQAATRPGDPRQEKARGAASDVAALRCAEHANRICERASGRAPRKRRTRARALPNAGQCRPRTRATVEKCASQQRCRGGQEVSRAARRPRGRRSECPRRTFFPASSLSSSLLAAAAAAGGGSTDQRVSGGGRASRERRKLALRVRQLRPTRRAAAKKGTFQSYERGATPDATKGRGGSSFRAPEARKRKLKKKRLATRERPRLVFPFFAAAVDAAMMCSHVANTFPLSAELGTQANTADSSEANRLAHGATSSFLGGVTSCRGSLPHYGR